MSTDKPTSHRVLPLAGTRVLEKSDTVAAAYAGRLLATLGADVIMLEPAEGSALRSAPPYLEENRQSALFAYLAAGKRSLTCDLATPVGQQTLARELQTTDILIDDTPVNQRKAFGLDAAAIGGEYPSLVHVSVLPFGASGPRADWQAEELNLMHASGEGFLLPNGLANELFPERPPLKIYGHFASYQGGCVAALSALAALWAVPANGGQYVDVSVQDAMLLCGCFALQRLGDGSLEHRATRSFRYGGVFETEDGYVELLTLEDRQWQGLITLLGNPEWSNDNALSDPLERSRRGAEINRHVRRWMLARKADDIVERAQQLGVPIARYRRPDDVVAGEHEQSRGLFAPVTLLDGSDADMLVAPYQFTRTPLKISSGVPSLGEMNSNEASVTAG